MLVEAVVLFCGRSKKLEFAVLFFCSKVKLVELVERNCFGSCALIAVTKGTACFPVKIFECFFLSFVRSLLSS